MCNFISQWKIQVRFPMRYHFIPTDISLIFFKLTSIDKNMEKMEGWQSLKMLNIELPYDALVDIYPRELKT